MTSSNFNLCFLALVLCMTNIRSETDVYTQSRKPRKSNPNNILKIIKFDNIILQIIYYEHVIEVIQIWMTV